MSSILLTLCLLAVFAQLLMIVDADKCSDLIDAAKDGNLAKVKANLDGNVNTCIGGGDSWYMVEFSVLHAAVSSCSLGTVKVVIKAGADLEKGQYQIARIGFISSPLHEAASRNFGSIATALIRVLRLMNSEYTIKLPYKVLQKQVLLM